MFLQGRFQSLIRGRLRVVPVVLIPTLAIGKIYDAIRAFDELAVLVEGAVNMDNFANFSVGMYLRCDKSVAEFVYAIFGEGGVHLEREKRKDADRQRDEERHPSEYFAGVVIGDSSPGFLGLATVPLRVEIDDSAADEDGPNLQGYFEAQRQSAEAWEEPPDYGFREDVGAVETV